MVQVFSPFFLGVHPQKSVALMLASQAGMPSSVGNCSGVAVLNSSLPTTVPSSNATFEVGRVALPSLHTLPSVWAPVPL